MEVKISESALESMSHMGPSDYVRFTKNGLRFYDWDGGLGQYVEKEIEPNDIFRHLRRGCSIDHEVTLGDIFKAVGQHELLMHFLSDYCWCPVDEFHDEALKPREKPDGDIHYLGVYKYIEIAKRDALSKHDSQITIGFHGIGKADEHGMERYAVDFSPMNDIAHFRVVLNPEIEFWKEREKIAGVEASYTLLEVLDAIYNEISFHGGPEDREAVSKEIQAAKARIDAGHEKLLSMDEVFGKDRPVN